MFDSLRQIHIFDPDQNSGIIFYIYIFENCEMRYFDILTVSLQFGILINELESVF